MGFSSFWSSLRGKHHKDEAAHDRRRDTRYQAPSPTTRTPMAQTSTTRTPMTQNNTAWDVHTPQVEQPSAKAKRRSFFRPSEQQYSIPDEPLPLATPKTVKRRSFWRSAGASAYDPASQPPVPLLPTSKPLQSWDPPTTAAENKKANRVSRTWSVNSKKSTRRKERTSWFGGVPDEADSDDDVPAVPAIPTYLAYERRRDLGNKAGMFGADDFSMGMAITSDDYQAATAVPSGGRDAARRSQVLNNRKSTSSIKSTTSQKANRKSWFGANAADSDVPPVPVLGYDSLPSPNTNSTFGSDFERFLVQAHNATVDDTPKPSDYEQFMSQSAAYDIAKDSQRRNPMDREPRTATTSFAVNAKKRASYGTNPRRPSAAATRNASVSAIRKPSIAPLTAATRNASVSAVRKPSIVPSAVATRKPSVSSPTTPQTTRLSWKPQRNTLTEDPESDIVIMTPEQQVEWEKLKLLMNAHDERDEDGVLGMLREYERDEGKDSWVRELPSRQRESVYANEQAMSALEGPRSPAKERAPPVAIASYDSGDF